MKLSLLSFAFIFLGATSFFSCADDEMIIMEPELRKYEPCYCPMVYDPVTCSNGVTYSNSCVAGCAGQTDCSGGGASW